MFLRASLCESAKRKGCGSQIIGQNLGALFVPHTNHILILFLGMMALTFGCSDDIHLNCISYLWI